MILPGHSCPVILADFTSTKEWPVRMMTSMTGQGTPTFEIRPIHALGGWGADVTGTRPDRTVEVTTRYKPLNMVIEGRETG